MCDLASCGAAGVQGKWEHWLAGIAWHANGKEISYVIKGTPRSVLGLLGPSVKFNSATGADGR